jgi:hypothetical protein
MKDSAMMSELLSAADEMIAHFRNPSSINSLPPAIAKLMRSSFEEKANKVSSSRTLAEHAMLIYKSANLVHDDDVHYHRVSDYISGVIVKLECEMVESKNGSAKKRLIKRITSVSDLLGGLNETYALYIAHKTYII